MLQERLNMPAIAATALLGGVVLSGCAGSPSVMESTAPVTTQPAPVENKDGANQLSIHQTYFPNGTRLTTVTTGDDHYYPVYRRSIAWCEGSDLVERTGANDYSGSSMVRSVGHVACRDGRLTPSDFPDTAR